MMLLGIGIAEQDLQGRGREQKVTDYEWQSERQGHR
jgi:hypothetical protein